ncbi:hypothetical protein IQ241_22880 [Romeria aff. gracilis LEGE 07310]|uniref:Uncharacterized protein n=1 Tax=Vasconcelosia minhoensis LEGE 07310 TaxID=915328 RepID=A0A8J7ASR5_9CYAN|nr:hypothetical protein [Romeria gracilis]MBE9080101.1 hypothetical protein [Romeria aff. gracilis LEGE 07310]
MSCRTSSGDVELFEVLLNSVGAKSVDDLSDIFVTRAFTKAGTITKEERVHPTGTNLSRESVCV